MTDGLINGVRNNWLVCAVVVLSVRMTCRQAGRQSKHFGACFGLGLGLAWLFVRPTDKHMHDDNNKPTSSSYGRPSSVNESSSSFDMFFFLIVFPLLNGGRGGWGKPVGGVRWGWGCASMSYSSHRNTWPQGSCNKFSPPRHSNETRGNESLISATIIATKQKSIHTHTYQLHTYVHAHALAHVRYTQYTRTTSLQQRTHAQYTNHTQFSWVSPR